MSDDSQFKIVPDGSDLDAQRRDLRFHPASPEHARVLTPEQVAQFNALGHLPAMPILEAAEADSLRAYFDELLARELAAGRDSYSISSAHCQLGRVYDLLCDRRIVDVAVDLLGENVIGWGSHFFCKLPGDGKRVDWHQDASYWPLTPSKAVTFWLAIDDADIANGCMQFISGSHHFGHLTYRPSDENEQNVLNQSIENPHQYGSEYLNEVPAGSASVHSDLLLHGSEPNDSSRRRCALTLRYCAADVRAYMDWSQKGVWVAGADPTGHWSNRTRPDGP